jgi:hypothetical protein
MAKYKVKGDGVYDTARERQIPNMPGNKDWRAYKEWLAAGNTPDPEFTQAELDQQAKDTKMAQINKDFIDGQKQPVVCAVNGTTYQMDGDENATVRMDRGIRFAEQVGATAMDIVDFNNNVHKGVSLTDCKQIRLMQAQFYYNLYMKRATDRATVLNG